MVVTTGKNIDILYGKGKSLNYSAACSQTPEIYGRAILHAWDPDVIPGSCKSHAVVRSYCTRAWGGHRPVGSS